MQRKTVLITGCSSGIGEATARLFLEEDWRVYATARDPDDLASLAGHEECRALELDVTVDADCRHAVNRVVQESGRIDCLVNNAGYGQFGPVEDVPVDQVRRQFDVNVYGPHRLTREVLPHMREQGEGTVVNLSSPWGRVAGPGTGVYSGSKFALEAMTDALRAEVAEYGLDAVLVQPGPVDTEFLDRAAAEVAPDGDGGAATDGSGDRGSRRGSGTTDAADAAAESSVPGVERSGAYESFYRIFEDSRLIGGGAPWAIAPEHVAEIVVEAACSPNPRARYPVGMAARAGIAFGYLPDRLRDTLFAAVQRIAGR